MATEIAAHGGIVDPGAVGDPSQRNDATPVSKASERAASTIAAACWRFFFSVRARWKISCATAEITCMTLFASGCAKFRTVP